MPSTKDDRKKKSVLEDKEKFETSQASEKLSHMGDKPGSEPRQPKPSQTKSQTKK
jgi:hypothetical protein